MEYQEPMNQSRFRFEMVARDGLRLSPYQRDYSSSLTKKLLNSVGAGFVVPIIVVEVDGEYIVVDGQHRLGALDSMSVEQNPLVPCVILPEVYKNYPLFYNIEKTDNIKDKSKKLHRIYMDKMASAGELCTEREINPAANFEPYIFTLAFSYMESGLKSPSLVESPIKKVDNQVVTSRDGEGLLTVLSLEEAVEVRRERAANARRLEETVDDVAFQMDISDFNLKKSIVSQGSKVLWGNKRKLNEDPEDAIPNLTRTIQELDWSWMARK